MLVLFELAVGKECLFETLELIIGAALCFVGSVETFDDSNFMGGVMQVAVISGEAGLDNLLLVAGLDSSCLIDLNLGIEVFEDRDNEGRLLCTDLLGGLDESLRDLEREDGVPLADGFTLFLDCELC